METIKIKKKVLNTLRRRSKLNTRILFKIIKKTRKMFLRNEMLFIMLDLIS